MMRRRLFLVVLAAWVSFGAGPSAPDAIRVTPLVRDGQVYVTLRITGAFSNELRDTIKSGLQTTFVYDFELRRGVALWVDRTLALATVQASVHFDNLTQRHQLSRSVDGRVEAATVTESEAEAERWLTSFERLALFSSAELEPNSEYYVRVRVQARPRSTWSFWPWERGSAWGHARFTFLP
jgi:uncharacterized protein DUF4390